MLFYASCLSGDIAYIGLCVFGDVKGEKAYQNKFNIYDTNAFGNGTYKPCL
jgi:hypothetical protein